MNNKDSGITLYGADWCGDCVRVKFTLDNFGLNYTYIDIDSNADKADLVLDYNEKVKGERERSIPVVVFSDESVLIEPHPKELYKKLIEQNLVEKN